MYVFRKLPYNVISLCVCCKVQNCIFSATNKREANHKRQFTAEFAIAQSEC